MISVGSTGTENNNLFEDKFINFRFNTLEMFVELQNNSMNTHKYTNRWQYNLNNWINKAANSLDLYIAVLESVNQKEF